MIQINKNDCLEIGYIQKPHGLKGELIIVFDNEMENAIEDVEILFIEVDGGLVPFFTEEEGLRFKTDQSAICRLEFVDTLFKAKELVGCKVYVPNSDYYISDDQNVTSPLIGMRAFDSKYGDIGLISRVDDFSGNLVITVAHPRTEILISLSDEIITSIDEEKGEIHLNCPNGLIEIYLK